MFELIPKQEEALQLFGSNALFILLFGGSRSTKTFTIMRTIINRALASPGSRHAVLRFRFNHVKSSVIMDTFPKVMELCFPGIPAHVNKSDWYWTAPNGSQIWFGGLDDKERTEKILGNEYASIFLNECSQISYSSFLILITRLAQKCFYMKGKKKTQLRLKMYCDENPPMKGHWTYRLFIEGKDPDTKRPIEDPSNYAHMLMNPVDNAVNLPGTYIKALENMPKRQRDRFLLGKFGDEAENGLWSTEIIEGSKVDDVPEMVRIVVAVDPSGASDDESTNNDDIGIVVGGLGVDGLGYVLEDLTIKKGPATWGGVVASAYERHEADRVIGESNFGGAMVEFVVKAANSNISYKAIHASRSKMVRAEPISALHETGKIKFVGDFPDLEDELLSCTTTGYTGARSPNRLDAFVFVFTELFPGMTKKKQPERAPIIIPKLNRMAR